MEIPHNDGATLHSLPNTGALDRADMAELLAERRKDGLQAIFYMLDAMPPGTMIEATGLAALLALAIEE